MLLLLPGSQRAAMPLTARGFPRASALLASILCTRLAGFSLAIATTLNLCFKRRVRFQIAKYLQHLLQPIIPRIVSICRPRHTALPEAGSIRLIECTSSLLSRPWLSLKTVPLDNCPPYIAVSYTWGPAVDIQEQSASSAQGVRYIPLPCDLGLVSINEILMPALALVRNGTFKSRHIWIDALCIDQTNLQECAAQVELMGEIYSSAEEVVVCLGDADLEDEFWWLHDEYYPALQSAVDKDGGELVKQYTPLNATLLPKIGLSKSADELRKAWRSFNNFHTRRRWFNRAWTLQEYCLAQKISMLYGKRHIPIDKVVGLVKLVEKLNWYIEVKFNEGHIPGERLATIESFRQTCNTPALDSRNTRTSWELYGYKRDPTELESWYMFFLLLVMAIQERDCAQRHDKVFSLLGMLKKHLPKPVEMSTLR